MTVWTKPISPSPTSWSETSRYTTAWSEKSDITVDTYDSSTDTYDGGGTTAVIDNYDGRNYGSWT